MYCFDSPLDLSNTLGVILAAWSVVSYLECQTKQTLILGVQSLLGTMLWIAIQRPKILRSNPLTRGSFILSVITEHMLGELKKFSILFPCAVGFLSET